MHPFSADDDGYEEDHLGDELLADRVAATLRSDPRIRGRRIELVVQNRVVILLGDVDTAEAGAAAGRAAWGVPGVFDVCNRLGVAGGSGPAWWDGSR
ncbi:BON domain-containing protein [Actinoplanes sp. NPDC023714]|uniref:BON domain-containing protein n=1 Tax=Actinoplanes sp. NPDC023714 TaxID=3154322 RepID=UPI0033CE5458